jgi:GDP-4-dehydro-6-deoxy-D-mannose reductase
VKDVLIIGGTGFVGQHMARQCPDGTRVTTVGRNSNICDKESIRKLINFVKPSVVVNFASVTTVSESFANPRLCYSVSFDGMLNLLEVLGESEFRGVLLYASSSEVYGHPHEETLPLCESSSRLIPMSPYAVGKIAAEYLCQHWHQRHGIKIIIARPFTHIGPGQSDQFAISSFARQIAQIVLGLHEPIMRVGNLNTTRDLTDVRDIVRAYWSLIDRGHLGEIYNVCSGIERNIGDVLQELISASGHSIQVESDPTKLRKHDQQRIKGSFNKINNDIGWRPEIDFSTTLKDLLEYWVDEFAKDLNKC